VLPGELTVGGPAIVAGAWKYKTLEAAVVSVEPTKLVMFQRYAWPLTKYPLGRLNDVPVSGVVVVPLEFG
jgi:hypothetical protein